MARSRKRHPIRGITSADSEEDKRTTRRKVHEALSEGDAPEVLPQTREVSNVRTMAKDGKIYLGKNVTARDLRKRRRGTTV